MHGCKGFFSGNPDLHLPMFKSVLGHPWEKIMFIPEENMTSFKSIIDLIYM